MKRFAVVAILAGACLLAAAPAAVAQALKERSLSDPPPPFVHCNEFFHSRPFIPQARCNAVTLKRIPLLPFPHTQGPPVCTPSLLPFYINT